MTSEATGTEQAKGTPASEPQPHVRIMDGRQRRQVTIASALVVCVAFVAMAIARNNYDLWAPKFYVIELVVATLASILAGCLDGMEERGYRWASTYLTQSDSLLFEVVRLLPVAACRAAIMTACLSIVNATVVPTLIFRETVEMPVLAVPIRFLADIPQCILLCLIVLLVVDRKSARS